MEYPRLLEQYDNAENSNIRWFELNNGNLGTSYCLKQQVFLKYTDQAIFRRV